MSTTEKVSLAKTGLVREVEWRFDSVIGHCESPIEQLWAATLMARGYFDGEWGFLKTDPRIEGIVGWKTVLAARGKMGLWLVQPTIILRGKAARLDFALLPEDGFRQDAHVRVAIELDGHDFHERTKKQATRDKSRDRALQALGWRILRFTGSEVHSDCEEAVVEAEMILEDELWAAWKRRGSV